MPVDSEHGCPICSLDSFGQLAGTWNIWKGQWEPTIMLGCVWPSRLATPAWPSADLSFLDSLTSDHSKHCCQVRLLKSPFKVVKPCLKDQQGLFVSRRVLNTSISDRPVLHPHRPSDTLLMPPSQSLPISSFPWARISLAPLTTQYLPTLSRPLQLSGFSPTDCLYCTASKLLLEQLIVPFFSLAHFYVLMLMRL